VANEGDSDSERSRSHKNRRRLGHIAEVIAAEHGRRLLVSYKPTIEAIQKENLGLVPAGVEFAHFGGLVGLDRWKDFPAILIAGRNRPNVEALERLARGFYWDDPEPLITLGTSNLLNKDGGLRLRDGRGRRVQVEYHPDPRTNDLLDSVQRCELEQAIHRLRGIRRNEGNQAHVYILTDVPLDIDIDHLTTWDEMVSLADPVEVMLARGLLPLSWSGVATLMPELFETPSAAKMRFRKHDPQLGAKYDVVAAALKSGSDEFVSFPYKYIYRGTTRSHAVPGEARPPRQSAFICARYRPRGERQSKKIFVDLRHHPDPHNALVRVLGPLDDVKI